MFTRVFIVALFVCVCATSALAQSLLLSKKLNLYLNNEVMGDEAWLDRARVNARNPWAEVTRAYNWVGQPPSDNASLAVISNHLYGVEWHELTPLDAAFEGAQVGMTLGLVAGALAGAAGAWDEDTSWWVAGAMTALGALIGGTRAKEPTYRVHIRWNTANQPRK